MNKEEIRKIYYMYRKKLSKKDIKKFSINIFKMLKNIPIWDNKYYHIYIPIKKLKEVDTYYIINFLLKKKKKLLYHILILLIFL